MATWELEFLSQISSKDMQISPSPRSHYLANQLTSVYCVRLPVLSDHRVELSTCCHLLPMEQYLEIWFRTPVRLYSHGDRHAANLHSPPQSNSVIQMLPVDNISSSLSINGRLTSLCVSSSHLEGYFLTLSFLLLWLVRTDLPSLSRVLIS
jgi:hypothetical protein